MFRTFIYLNEKQVKNFSAILSNQPQLIEKKVTKTGNVGALGIGGELSEEFTYSEENTIESIYHKFENGLSKLEGKSFYDFALHGEDYAIPNLDSSIIFKVKSYLKIPEKFDMLITMENLKSHFLTSEQIASLSNDHANLVTALFENTSADIPLLIDMDEVTLSGKLTSDFLLYEYHQLEEYEESEVTVLCKFEGLVEKDSVQVYDPAKDFVKLNRTTRRHLKEKTPEQMSPIFVEGPVAKVEILAIYK